MAGEISQKQSALTVHLHQRRRSDPHRVHVRVAAVCFEAWGNKRVVPEVYNLHAVGEDQQFLAMEASNFFGSRFCRQSPGTAFSSGVFRHVVAVPAYLDASWLKTVFGNASERFNNIGTIHLAVYAQNVSRLCRSNVCCCAAFFLETNQAGFQDTLNTNLGFWSRP